MGHELEDQEQDVDRRDGPRPVVIASTALVILVTVVATVIVFVYAAGSGDRAARNACRAAVSEQLTAPATARWHDETVTKQGAGYEVRGTVDSQNSFGALLPTRFRCTVTNGTAVVDYTV